MSDHRLVIIPCEYEDFPCSSYICDQPSREKYWVGNPHSNNLPLFPIFCKSCIEHLVNHLPPDLSPTTASVEKRLRKELENEYQAKMQLELANQREAIRVEVTAKLIAEFAKPETREIPPIVEAEEEKESAVVYRCLDCGEELDSAADLEAHRQTHVEAAPKRGRKKS